MGYILPDNKLMTRHPRASKQIDRDTAVRWRKVPADECFLTGDHIYIPRQFMLLSVRASSDLLLELQSRVSKLEQIIRDLGHSVHPSATVLPMRSNAKRKGQQTTTVVPGNEAEELYPQSTEPDTPSVVPSALAEASKPSGKVVQLPTKAANDGVIEASPYLNIGEPKEAEASVSESSLDSHVRSGLKQFGFTPDEALGILKAEHAIRDAHCKRTHNGVNFIDLRILRAFAKEGTVTANSGYFKSQYTKFAEFMAHTADVSRVPDYENIPLQHQYATWDNMWYDWKVSKRTSPEAERKRDKRRVLQLKLDIRERQGSAQFQRELRFCGVNLEAHEPILSFNFKAWRRAKASAWRDTFDKVRTFFGRPPPDRRLIALAKVAAEYGPDLKSTTAELVRGYQRQGISHC